MRLDNYIDKTLNEKVTKKEKTQALKNPNVLIGCEFELKLDDISSSKKQEYSYNNAMADYHNYNEAVDEYNQELSEYNDESEEMKSELDEISEELDDISVSIDETEELINDIDKELDALKNDLSKEEQDRKIFLQDRKNDLEDNKQNEESKLDKLQKKYDDLEEEIKDREDRDIEIPYLNRNLYSDYIDYLENYMGVFELYEPDSGEKLSIMPEYYDDDDNFVSNLESSNVLNDFPFSPYEVGVYGDVVQSVGDDLWAIENDESVDDGIEVKSPPTKLPDFIPDQLIDMFDWIDEVGYTDNQCGFHVHMSLKQTKGIDPLKLLLFTEENYIYNLFQDRKNNIYVKSIKDKLKKEGSLNKNDLNKILNVKFLNSKIITQHYDGVNIIDIEHGHVEFRYMGGSNYQRKEKDIIDIISSYAYWLSLSSDPEFKKKEYIHKLYRIFNKMDIIEYMFNIYYIEYYQSNDIHSISKIKTDVIKDKYTKLLKNVKGTYKLDKKTRLLISQNISYMDSLQNKIEKEISSVVHKDDDPTKNSKFYGIHVDIRNKIRK